VAAVVLAAATGAAVWIVVLSARLDAARSQVEAADLRLAEALAEIDDLAALNARNVAELEEIRRDHEVAQDVLRRQSVQLAAAARAVAAAQGERRHADPADNWPLPAAVLRGLRELRAAGQGGDGDGDPARGGGAAGGDAR